MDNRESPYIQYLHQRQQDGLQRTLINCTHPAPGIIRVNEKNYLNLSTNDYLGLSHHPETRKRATEWAEQYGTGSEASRLVTGNIECFQPVEEKIAKLKQKEAALIFPSGFQANASILHALLDKRILGSEPLVFADKLNHSSMHFGCAAAQARQIRYRHLDMDHLSQLLEKHKDKTNPRFILTESVFSMDGDIAPMKTICKLAEQYNCIVICDDAHATGILGENGEGLSDNADIVIGTFSKALGSIGAYVACSSNIRNFLLNHCTGIIYSTALPPSVLGTIDAALDLLPHMEQERQRVSLLAENFRKKLNEKGFDTAASATQIVPIVIGNTQKTLETAAHLKTEGYWVSPIRPPTVPKGTSRLRVSFCPHHPEQEVMKMVDLISNP